MAQLLRDQEDEAVRQLCPRAIVLDASLVLQPVPAPLRSLCGEAAIGTALAQAGLPVAAQDLQVDAQLALAGEAAAPARLMTASTGELFRVRMQRYTLGDGDVRVLVTFDDVTEVHAALRDSFAAFTGETRHRIRNMLGVLRSLVNRAIGSARDLNDYAARIEGRLNALTRIQSVLSVGIDAGIDLEYLIAEEFVANGLLEGAQFTIAGPALRLQIKAAEALSLVIHELCRNAVEHGALRADTGCVDVAWRINGAEDGRRLQLDWRERGGPAVVPPDKAGYGREIIEHALAFEFGAQTTLHFAPQGLSCSIQLPLARIVAARGAAL